MAKNLEEPKDLGIKIGTKEQVIWERVAKEARVLLQQNWENQMIQKGLLALALEKIEKEKEKFK